MNKSKKVLAEGHGRGNHSGPRDQEGVRGDGRKASGDEKGSQEWQLQARPPKAHSIFGALDVLNGRNETGR